MEAKLLNAVNFPPLQRKLHGYTNSTNDFYGFMVQNKIAGVIEIDANYITLETGAANGPATQLYLKSGFTEIGLYQTDHGIRKVRFEMRRDENYAD